MCISRLFFIILMLVSEALFATPKTALVIGNSAYRTSPLVNPYNDAKAMAKSLSNLGFQVMEFTDLDRSGMRKAIRDFGNQLKKGGVGLFFYAGHGIQIKGRNYLIPIGTDVSSADEVQDESVDAGMVLRKMESAGNDFNIVIMDACRNNPFARSFRSLEQGLARMEGPVGSIIAYATAPGSTAADGVGKNGLYTSYLLQAMEKPDLSIEEVFKEVRINVRAKSSGKQIPWESSSLTGHFQFVENKKPAQQVKTVEFIPPPPAPYILNHAGHLQVTANVSGGVVFVNNIKRGYIAKNHVLNLQNISQDEVEVRLEMSGYKSQTQKIQLQKGEWQQVYFELFPNNASVKTSLPEVSSQQKKQTMMPITKPQVVTIKNSPIADSGNEMVFNFDSKKKSSGIVATDISPEGRFSLNRNHAKRLENIPSTIFSTIPNDNK